MNRSLIIITMGISGVIIGIAGLVRYIKENPPALDILLNGDEARRHFLSECGRAANEEPPAQLEITLPASGGSSVFRAYCDIQSKQRLPLSEHFSETAVVWTYTLECAPTARAELVCTPEGVLIGAMYYDCTSFENMYPLIISE